MPPTSGDTGPGQRPHNERTPWSPCLLGTNPRVLALARGPAGCGAPPSLPWARLQGPVWWVWLSKCPCGVKGGAGMVITSNLLPGSSWLPNGCLWLQITQEFQGLCSNAGFKPCVGNPVQSPNIKCEIVHTFMWIGHETNTMQD